MKQLPKIKGLEIVKKLAEGGQGTVYVAKKNGKTHALKLYHQKDATADQREIIQSLVNSGVPAKKHASRFAWPEALIEWPEGNTFGYLMPLIDTSKYISLKDVESGRVPHPGYGVMIQVCRWLAELFRTMHIEGHCYRDPSKDNFLFSPKTGDVIICDNDNIIIDKLDLGNIGGTTPFMAPEVILGKSKPSTVTDQHSLAVLMFCLLCGGNPFHGKMEYHIKVMDMMASRYLYGQKPVFIFHPTDSGNRLPDVQEYKVVEKRWKVLPSHIKDLFVKAFTVGLHNPSARVTDLEWGHALSLMLGMRHLCVCRAENFWDPAAENQQPCWNCGREVSYPGKLYFKDKSVTAMLIKPGHQVSTLHFGDKSNPTLVGTMEADATDSSMVVLRNKTTETWTANFGGQRVEVPPQRAIPLLSGATIKAGKRAFLAYP